MKLSLAFLVLCLLPLAAMAIPRPPLNSYTKALLCSQHFTPDPVKPQPGQLKNYAGKIDLEEVGKRRFDLWRAFTLLSSPQAPTPFVLALNSRAKTYLDNLGPIEIVPMWVENGPPAHFHIGHSNIAPKLFLNVAYYDEDPNVVFAQAIWKMWVVRQFRNGYRHEHSALNILKEATVRASSMDWSRWKERLSGPYASSIKWLEEEGVVPADVAETKLVDIASEILALGATYRFYNEKTAIGSGAGEWLKSKFWEKANHAREQRGNHFFEWFMFCVAERFNVNPSDVEFIAKALNSSGLREAWEFSDVNERLPLPSPKVRITDPDGSVSEISFIRVGFEWWVKETVHCTILKARNSRTSCEQRIVHRHLNPLQNWGSRFKAVPINDGEISIEFYLFTTMEMSNGSSHHFTWTPVKLRTVEGKDSQGNMRASAAFGSGIHPKQPNAEIDELLMKRRGKY